MTGEWSSTLNCQTDLVYTKYLPLRSKFWSASSYDQALSRYKVVENRECTKWPQNDLENVMVKSTLSYTKYLPQGPNFWSVMLYDQPFSRYKAVENRKIGNVPTSRMTLNTYVRTLSNVPCVHRIHKMPNTEWPWGSVSQNVKSLYRGLLGHCKDVFTFYETAAVYILRLFCKSNHPGCQ